MTVKKNTYLNLLGVILPLIAALICIPGLLSGLGKEKFSILLMIWALIGYFSLFDFGVGRALTYEIAQIKDGEKTIINAYILAGGIIVLISAIIGFLLVYCFAKFGLPYWYNLPTDESKDIFNALSITAVAIIPTTITNGLRGALEGLNKFTQSNINKAILGISVFVLPLISIKIHGNSLATIAFYLLTIRIMVTFLAIFQIKSYIFTVCSLNPIKLIPKIFSYGFWVAVSGIAGPLMIYGDRFLLGSILNIETITYYATPQEGLLKLLVIPGALASALFYDFSKNSTNTQKLHREIYIYQKKIALVMGAIVIAISLMAHWFYKLWIDTNFANNAYIPTVIMAIGIFFNSIGLIHLTTLSALGKVKYIGFFHTVEVILFFPLFYFFTKEYGLIGASIVWAGRGLVDFILLSATTKIIFIQKKSTFN